MNVRLSACTLGSYHATPVCSSLCPSSPFFCPIVVLSGAMHVEKVPASIIFSSALYVLCCSNGLSWLPTACSAQRAGAPGSSLHVSQQQQSPRVPARSPRTVVGCSVSAPLTGQRQALAGARCRRALSGPRWRHWLGPLAGTHWLRMLPCHLLMPFPPFCVRDPDCGDQASLSTSEGYVRLGLSHCSVLPASVIIGGALSCSVSLACGFGCGIGAGLCVGRAMEVCIAMASVVAPFSLRWWRFKAFPPHLKPLPFCSRLHRWSFYHSGEMHLLAWFFRLPATLLQNLSIGQLYVFRVCCLGLSDQRSLRRRPWLERQPPA